MNSILWMTALLGATLAFVNGANDVSKGIATLVGSGITQYRRAIAWGAAWTGVGSLLGSMFAGAMLATFGSGLITHDVHQNLTAAIAALVGATAWVMLATRLSLPVSTTHAIVGAVIGVVTTAYGADAMQWRALGSKVIFPLLVSPLLAMVLTLVLARGFARGRVPEGAACVHAEATLAHGPRNGLPKSIAIAGATLQAFTGTSNQSGEQDPNVAQTTLSRLHWITSGATSLARGMNDAPKIVALAAAAGALAHEVGQPSPTLLYAVVTIGIVTGSLLAGRCVTRVLAEDVTPMDNRGGFAANLVTAGLVISGAVHGLPMSTTHVASGAIFGIGMHQGSMAKRPVRDMLLAWLITLPAAAALAAAGYLALRLAIV